MSIVTSASDDDVSTASTHLRPTGGGGCARP